MDYEKKYKEALTKSKEFYEKCKQCGAKITEDFLKNAFPELAESKDEKIRKALVDALNKNLGNGIEKYGITLNAALTWLDKQGEQKPVLDFKASNWYVSKVDGKIHDMTYNSADKVEPKFKVGSILKHNNSNAIVEVLSVNVGFYCLRNILGGDEMELSNVEKNFHLWTIADAKDGDVLVGNKGDVILMFRRIGNAEWNDVIDYHCYYDCYRKDFIVQKDVQYWGDTNNNQLKPATKEQCDLLFQKMKEAGYEWDAEKKELKKIEQKPSEWSDEDDYNIQCMIAKVTYDIQKGNDGRNNELIDWLKSIKNRVQPQPKQEWSEEDDAYKLFAISAVEDYYDEENPLQKELVDWLKSIKDRITWKPSKEQMEALEYYMHTLLATEHKEVLFGLYNDLKKL